MNNIFSMYQQFMQNPVQMLNKKFNVPQEMNNPDEIINHLVNSGQVKQSQIDSIRNNPMLRNFMGMKF